ncbi:MAG: DUF4349 domain-containing protein [Geodermatophilaceae bacterium]|nr:DUF4349 domain-containing protein [Geodermatophilaceae bacterium]
MTRSTIRSRTGRAAVLAVLGAMLLAGCSGGGSDSGAESAVNGGGGGSSGDFGSGEESPGGDDGGTAGEPGTALPLGPQTLDRQIIVTAEIRVRSQDVQRDADRAAQQATTLGGIVSGDVRGGSGSQQTADLVLRVPPERVDQLLDALAGFGEEVSRSVRTEDVTTVKADVDSRVESLQASLDRLRGLLADASDITDLVALERELAARESDLESLQAQQRALGDQISLATVSLSLVAEAPEPEDETAGFLGGLGTGWDAFLTVGSALLTALGASLPFLVLVGLIVGTVGWVSRRRHRLADPPAAPVG